MKTRTLNLFLLVLIGIFHTNCNLAKILKGSKDEKIEFISGPKKITYYENQILLDTEFSDGIIRNFLVDLGSPISVVFIDQSLKKIIVDEKPVSNVGNTKSANGTKMKREYIHWGTLKTELFELNNSFLSSMDRTDPFACRKLSGMWGADIFSPELSGEKNKILKINMQDSTISVMDSLPIIDEWIPISVKFTNLSHIKIVINIGNQAVTFFFDTGFSGSLIVTRETYNKLIEESDLLYNKTKLYGYIHSSLSGANTDTAYSALCNLSLVESISSDSVPLVSTESIIVNAIGMEFIRRFNVLIDYQKKNLYLQPNPNYRQPKETFYITKGFKARNMNDNNLLIINLTVNGPAEKAGLEVGDQILSIDNIKANEGNNCEVVRLISELDGKSMQHNLIIKRGTETLSFQL